MSEHAGLAHALDTRVRLAAIEFAYERARIVQGIWAAVALIGCLLFALLALQALAVALLWPLIGPWALAALAGLWLMLAALMAAIVHDRRQHRAPAFMQLGAVLRADLNGLAAVWSGRRP